MARAWLASSKRCCADQARWDAQQLHRLAQKPGLVFRWACRAWSWVSSVLRAGVRVLVSWALCSLSRPWRLAKWSRRCCSFSAIRVLALITALIRSMIAQARARSACSLRLASLYCCTAACQVLGRSSGDTAALINQPRKPFGTCAGSAASATGASLACSCSVLSRSSSWARASSSSRSTWAAASAMGFVGLAGCSP
ncbi:hypothetical protein D3C79_762900 [compost metagenome]